MFKVFVFMKRKPGMSMEEFIGYYESTHAPLGVEKLPPFTRRYVRNYLTPAPTDSYPAGSESPFDVVTELLFDDEEAFGQAMAHLTKPENAAIITADEENLFDRASILFTFVEEHESALGPGKP